MSQHTHKSEPKSLRDALLATEPVNLELWSRYKKEIENMLDKKLSLWSRIVIGLFGAYLFMLGIAGVMMATGPLPTEPPSILWLWGIVSIGLVGFGGLLLFIVARGAYRQRWEGLAFAAIALWLTVAAGVQCMRILSELGGDDFGMFVWRVGGAVCLALAGLIVLLFVRGRIATRLEMRLLDIEYRLAQLTEKLEQTAEVQPPAPKA